MRVRVIQTFADKEITYKMYAVGEIISLPDERALNAIDRGLAVEMADAKAEEKKPTKTKRTKKNAE